MFSVSVFQYLSPSFDIILPNREILFSGNPFFGIGSLTSWLGWGAFKSWRKMTDMECGCGWRHFSRLVLDLIITFLDKVFNFILIVSNQGIGNVYSLHQLYAISELEQTIININIMLTRRYYVQCKGLIKDCLKFQQFREGGGLKLWVLVEYSIQLFRERDHALMTYNYKKGVEIGDIWMIFIPEQSQRIQKRKPDSTPIRHNHNWLFTNVFQYQKLSIWA